MTPAGTRLYKIIAAVAISLIAAGCGQNKAVRTICSGRFAQIRVAGGSIIVHATGNWNPVSSTFTTKLSKAWTGVELRGWFKADPSNSNAPVPASWTGLTAWEIDIADRSGWPNEGITLCSNAACDVSGGTWVPARSAEAQSWFDQRAACPTTVVSNGHGSDTPSFDGQRFYNSTCHNGSDNNMNIADLCERIKTVTIMYRLSNANTTWIYDCPEGECSIAIANSN